MKNDLINYKVEALSETEMENINGGARILKIAICIVIAIYIWAITPKPEIKPQGKF